jgi:UDP-glucose 4-epimerase
VSHRVILLGHTGFIGRALSAHLAAVGLQTHGFASSTLDLRRMEAFSALEGFVDEEATLIFASTIAPDRGVSPDTLLDNLAMAINVARYVETRSVRKCVYLSSDAVYGTGVSTVTERTPIEPTGFYALAKYTSERVLQWMADTRGIPLLVLRPTGVYGPGDTHNSYGPNSFVRSIVRERTVRLFGEGEELRDHLYIDDLVSIAARLTLGETRGVLNLASGTSRAFASIVDDLRRIAPYDFSIATTPRKAGVTHRRFDISCLVEALPELRFTPFEEGLRATFAAAERELV